MLIAQDCIGGAERKTRLLENENQKIQGELQFWNEVYQQDTGISRTAPALPSVNQPSVRILLPTSIPSISVASVQTAVSMEIPISLPTFTTPLSSPSFVFSTFTPEVQAMNANRWDDIPPAGPIRGNRDSFGSEFLRSLENM